MRTKRKLISSILAKNLHSRDDDFLLYQLVVKEYGLEGLGMYDLLSKVSFTSVVACKGRIQRGDESLRGKRWEKKMKQHNEIRKKYRPTYWHKLKNYLAD